MVHKHYRVSCLMQSGGEILRQQKSGKLCFFVTSEVLMKESVLYEDTDPLLLFN